MAQDPVTDSSGGNWPVFNRGMTYREIGSSGLRQFGGWVREEFLPQLVGRQAARVYREMGDNSATVGSILFAIIQSIRKVDWTASPADDSPEAAELAEFADSLRMDMSHTWEDFIAEALSMLRYGFAPHEIVYKKRLGPKPPDSAVPGSKFNDGRIGLRRLPIRGQDTVLKWFFDDNGTVKGLTQQPWVGSLVDIPIEKLLLFRPSAHKNNPEGHALAPETPIPTPDGWTTMGEIRIGDRVYDDQGRICYVSAIADWQDRPMYEVELSDGSIIKADANHLWRLTTGNDRHNERQPRLLTTEQMLALKSQAKTDPSICLGETPVIEGFALQLPINPYILGYWLGDGSRCTSCFAISAEDFPSFAKQAVLAGYAVKHDGGRAAYVSDGLKQALGAFGLLNNKHVPAMYLRASADQRLALLQGLMDADGTSASGKDKASKFYNANEGLVAAVVELVRSLGGRPHVRVHQKAGRHGGIVNGRSVVAKKTLWEVSFYLDRPVHRLSRKAEKQFLKKSARVCGHFVTAVRKIGKGSSRCIEVTSPSHMFLCGSSMTPTHNSILRTAYRPWYFLKRLEEQEAVMLERFSGLPMVKVPLELMEQAAAGDAKALAALEQYQKIVTNVRIDEQMGLVLPSNTYTGGDGNPTNIPQYSFELVSPSGSKGGVNFDVPIGRYKIDIMTSVLADWLTLGHESRGTQSLALSKVDMFFFAIEGWIDSIAAVLNRYLLPRVWALNGLDLSLMPQYKASMPRRTDIDALGTFLLSLTQAGMPLFPDEELENWVREAAGLPDISDHAEGDVTGSKPMPTDPASLAKMIKAAGAQRVLKSRRV